MPTRLNVKPAKFLSVLYWMRRQGASAENPMHIDKMGNRTAMNYFLAWPFGGALLLKAHPNARVQSEYILAREQWDEYADFYAGLSREERERAEVYKSQKIIKDYTFYPVIPCITVKYNSR